MRAARLLGLVMSVAMSAMAAEGPAAGTSTAATPTPMTIAAGTSTTAAPGAEATAPAEKALTLRDLQRLASQADPRAQIAVAQLEGAIGKKEETDWIWFPQFTTTIGGGGPVGEARLKGGSDDALTDITDGTRAGLWGGGQWGATVRANMDGVLPIYTFGKIDAGKRAAAAGVKAREHLVERERRGVDLDVAKAYWGYQTTRDVQKSIEDVTKQVDAAKKTAKQLIAEESDQVQAQDLTRLEYIEQEIIAQNATAQKSQRVAEVALKLLVGRMPEESINVARESVPQPPVVLPTREFLLSKARDLRPDLRAAAENVHAREALLELERAKLYPDFGVAFGANYAWTSNATSPTTPFAYNPYNGYGYYVGLAVKGTFDFPQKFARIKQVEADLHEAQATQIGAERLARLEIESALEDLIDAKARAERYTAGAAIAKKLVVQSAIAFDSGLGQALDLFINLLLFQRGEGERFRGLYDAQIAWATLEKSVGGPLEQGALVVPPGAQQAAGAQPVPPAAIGK